MSDQVLNDVDRVVSGRKDLLDSLGIRDGDLISVDVRGAITHVRVLVADIAATATAGPTNLGFGQQILSFNRGAIVPLGAKVEYDITNTGAAAFSSGEVGIGTVVASGAVNVLGGTATFEDFMEGTAIAALVAATSQTDNIEIDGPRTAELDGIATAKDLFLNFAIAGTATGNFTITNIVVDLWFIFIPQTPVRS